MLKRVFSLFLTLSILLSSGPLEAFARGAWHPSLPPSTSFLFETQAINAVALANYKKLIGLTQRVLSARIDRQASERRTPNKANRTLLSDKAPSASIADPLFRGLRKFGSFGQAAYWALTVLGAAGWETWAFSQYGFSSSGFLWATAGFALAHTLIELLVRGFAPFPQDGRPLYGKKGFIRPTDFRDLTLRFLLGIVFLLPFGHLAWPAAMAVAFGLHATWNIIAIKKGWTVASIFRSSQPLSKEEARQEGLRLFAPFTNDIGLALGMAMLDLEEEDFFNNYDEQFGVFAIPENAMKLLGRLGGMETPGACNLNGMIFVTEETLEKAKTKDREALTDILHEKAHNDYAVAHHLQDFGPSQQIVDELYAYFSSFMQTYGHEELPVIRRLHYGRMTFARHLTRVLRYQYISPPGSLYSQPDLEIRVGMACYVLEKMLLTHEPATIIQRLKTCSSLDEVIALSDDPVVKRLSPADGNFRVGPEAEADYAAVTAAQQRLLDMLTAARLADNAEEEAQLLALHMDAYTQLGEAALIRHDLWEALRDGRVDEAAKHETELRGVRLSLENILDAAEQQYPTYKENPTDLTEAVQAAGFSSVEEARRVVWAAEHGQEYFRGLAPGVEVNARSLDTTLGEGIYLTDEESARRYAVVRAGKNGIVGSVYFSGRILDLRDPSMIVGNLPMPPHLLERWIAFLESELSDKNPYFVNGSIRKSIQLALTRGHEPFSKLTTNGGAFVSEFLKTEGYDALLVWEGGETGNEVSVGNHISLIVFDPRNVIPDAKLQAAKLPLEIRAALLAKHNEPTSGGSIWLANPLYTLGGAWFAESWLPLHHALGWTLHGANPLMIATGLALAYLLPHFLQGRQALADNKWPIAGMTAGTFAAVLIARQFGLLNPLYGELAIAAISATHFILNLVLNWSRIRGAYRQHRSRRTSRRRELSFANQS